MRVSYYNCVFICTEVIAACCGVCLDNVGAEFWKLQTNFGGELNGMQ